MKANQPASLLAPAVANIDPDTGEITAKAPQPPFLRTPYNYDRNAASDETGLSCPEETLTQQQFKDETDINTIVRRFGLTGEMPPNVVVPMTGDFTDAVTDYHSALNMVKAADAGFLTIPAEIRTQFDNDPGKLIAFLEDEKNRPKAIELGLVKAPPPAPAPAATPAAPAPQTPAA